MAGRERHRPAVLEIDDRTAPSRSRGAHGSTRKVVGSAIIRKSAPPSISGMPKPPPAREHRKHAAVRGVLGQQRGRDGAAVAHDAGGVGRHRGLAAQDAVLIGKRQPHDLEPVLLDQAFGPRRSLELLVAPQAVAFDEAHLQPTRSCDDDMTVLPVAQTLVDLRRAEPSHSAGSPGRSCLRRSGRPKSLTAEDHGRISMLRGVTIATCRSRSALRRIPPQRRASPNSSRCRA